MTLSRSLPLSTLLALSACGGSDPAAPAPAPNRFTGQLRITGTMPPGTTNCLSTSTVTFTASGASTQSVNMIAGGCVDFVAGDSGSYRPATIGAVACNELTSPTNISGGNSLVSSYLAGPMDGPRTCNWQDTLHPPSSGGGGGGGGGY
jgi:hypothetical protein